jgi:hypothetical protein
VAQNSEILLATIKVYFQQGDSKLNKLLTQLNTTHSKLPTIQGQINWGLSGLNDNQKLI